jgi:hypothetical protein
MIVLIAACGEKKKSGSDDSNEVDIRPYRHQDPEATEVELPSAEKRAQVFDDYVEALLRLDGEVMAVRELKGLDADWRATVAPMRAEFMAATTTAELGRALLRLDATLPNLHSFVSLNENHRWFPRGHVSLPFYFDPVTTSEGTQRFVVSMVIQTAWGLKPGEKAPLREKSRIVAINGRPMEEWQKENFGLCKRPLASQCDSELYYNLTRELLSWQRAQPLTVTVLVQDQPKEIKIPIIDGPLTAADKAAKAKRRLERKECGRSRDRYMDLDLVYEGNRLCVFESYTNPETLVLRITSFNYSKSMLMKNQEIRSMEQELELFRDWYKNSALTAKKIVFDVVGNGGGFFPLPYYELFLRSRFQEHSFRLKKATDLDDPELLSSALWGNSGLIRTMNHLREEGLWSATPWGKLLPNLPQFAPDDSADYRGQMFESRDPIFAGLPVEIIMDQDCVSACDAFVWTFKNRYTEGPLTLAGQANAADPAFVRMRVDVLKDWSLRVSGINDDESDTLFTQTISAAQSSDDAGAPLSGRPFAPDRFVEGWTWDYEWLEKAVMGAIPPVVE